MIGCKRYIVFTLIVLAVFILMPGFSFAWEKVENVRVEQVDNDVHIYYDLSGDSEKYNVTVRGSSDGGITYKLPMKTVSGDVGKKVRPGSNKKIIWKALKDAGQLEGDEFVFEVEAVSGPGKEFTNSIGMKFALIPAGSFMMGSPSSEAKRDSDERQHRVTLTKGFYMQATEVTIGQWRSFIGDTGYRTEAETGDGAYIFAGKKWEKKKGYYWDNPGFSQTEKHPVTCVSWNDVQKFIKWLNRKENKSYRLPTEAQWEYACRAGSDTPFYWGKRPDEGYANFADLTYSREFPSMKYANRGFNDGYVYTAPAGTFKPNNWGLYDMSGNVWEWCEDWYGDYPSVHVTDPEGASSGTARVLRGGSWYFIAGDLRSAGRGMGGPDGRRGHIGFRVVCRVARAY